MNHRVHMFLAAPLILVSTLALGSVAVVAKLATGVSSTLQSVTRAAGPGDTTNTPSPSSTSFSFDNHGTQPILQDGALVYPNVTPGVSYVQRYMRFGEQTLIKIDGRNAPQAYALTYNGLPVGGQLEISTDGSILVKDRSGNQTATISPAWAIDANREKIPSVYRITDAHKGTFTQTVGHQVSGVAYPVIADPLRLYINIVGVRAYWGSNGLELRLNNYWTGILIDGTLAVTAYLTGGGDLVIGLISKYSATAAKIVPWFSHSTAVWAISNNKCFGYTLPVYWWGVYWNGAKYWLENCS